MPKLKCKIFYFVASLLLLAATSYLVVVAPQRESVTYSSLETVIEQVPQGAAISREDVQRELEYMLPAHKNFKLDSISIYQIEKKLQTNGLFDRVNVYYTRGGTLHAHITPATPLFLVVEPERSYYVTSTKRLIAAQTAGKYAQPLLVVYGDVDKNMATGSLFELCSLIAQDPYWQHFFTSLYVTSNGYVIADTQYKHCSVNFGEPVDWAYKLWQLRLFIQRVIPKFSWSSFSQISIQYPDRITVTRR